MLIINYMWFMGESRTWVRWKGRHHRHLAHIRRGRGRIAAGDRGSTNCPSHRNEVERHGEGQGHGENDSQQRYCF